MIRSSKEREEISDKDFEEILKPHEQNVKKHIGEVIVYDYFAFVLASAYNHDCIWEDSTLEFEYIDAIDYLNSLDFPGYKKLDIKKISDIMREKYSLNIVSENPIKIEKIQP